MTYLYLIRHPKTHPDPALPASEWWLSDEGRMQVQMLVKAPFWQHVSAVYTSDQTKAKTVGQAVLVAHGIACHAQPDLAEAYRDSWLKVDDYQAAQRRFFSQPDAVPVDNWETAVSALARFGGALDRLLAAHPPDKSLAVVAHATVLTLYVTRLAGQPPTYIYWKNIGFAEVLTVDRASMRPVTGWLAAPFDGVPLPERPQ